jgi:methyl-accepting chemotaxis protein
MWSYNIGCSEFRSEKHPNWLSASQRKKLRPSRMSRHRYNMVILGLFSLGAAVFSQDKVTSMSEQAAASLARHCALRIATEVQTAEDRGELRYDSAFDRMYVPIPGSNPRRYKTSYDSWADRVIEPILKEILNQHDNVVYIFLTDPNGYIPVAPAVKPVDQIPSPATPKRILEAKPDREIARMTAPQKIRSMNTSSGNNIKEIAIPILVRNRVWCILRFAYMES